QLALFGQAEEFLIRHRRSQEIRQPRGERDVIEQRKASRRSTGHNFFFAIEKAWRSEHHGHRLSHACFEGLPRLGGERFDQVDQAIERDGISGSTISPSNKGCQQLACISTAWPRFVGNTAWIESLVIDRMDTKADCHRSALGQWLKSQRQGT